MDPIPVDKPRHLPLPLPFLEFLDENGIDPSIYSLGDSVPRYIRIKPGRELLVPEIEAELNREFRKVEWIPGFFSILPQVQIASSNAYRQGKLQLLSNGFRLLKVGGSLVYSTCSLTVGQNESIVEHFLSGNPNAELQEVDAAKFWPCKSGRISKTLRFDPSTSQTSGLFVAKIVKLPS